MTFKYSLGDISAIELGVLLDKAGVPTRTINQDENCLTLNFKPGLPPSEDQMKSVDRAIISGIETSTFDLAMAAMSTDHKGVRMVSHQAVIGPLLAHVVQMSARLEILEAKFKDWET